MRIRLAIPDQHVNADVLNAALEATTRAAQAQMQAGQAPTFTQMLRDGVRWRPERFSDGEHFDLPRIVGERGWGDCDDLAPALAAEMRATDPGAVARVIPSGPGRWHAIVQMSDGTLLDPSRMAGMRGRAGVRGAIARPMAALGKSAIAILPHSGAFWSRTDLPWDDGHLVSLARDRDLRASLDRSIAGAVSIGRCVGAWPDERQHATLRDVWGTVVGDAGSELADIARRVAEIAAAKVAPKGGSSGTMGTETIELPHGGRAVCSPGGPIIVRF